MIDPTIPPPCVVCGVDAITVFGYDPVCANTCCKQYLIDKVNGELAGLASEEQIEHEPNELEGEMF